jgi:CRISPR system Cascade subunit CasB
MESSTESQPSREQRFVEEVLSLINRDKGLAARLRRADNPDTEYQSWEVLARFGIDLEQENQRLPHTVLAAAISRSKATANGSLTLGQALAKSFDEGEESSPGKARLRRLLACQDLPELVRVLRGILTLIESRVTAPLDFIKLLRQLRRFPYSPQQVKAQWAQEFYRKTTSTPQEEAS